MIRKVIFLIYVNWLEFEHIFNHVVVLPQFWLGELHENEMPTKSVSYIQFLTTSFPESEDAQINSIGYNRYDQIAGITIDC